VRDFIGNRCPAAGGRRVNVEFAFMVMSALILAFIVLVREERYAMGEPGIFADAIIQMTQQNAPVRSGDRAVIPPSN